MNIADRKAIRDRIADVAKDPRTTFPRSDVLSLIADMEWLLDEIDTIKARASAKPPGRSLVAQS